LGNRQVLHLLEVRTVIDIMTRLRVHHMAEAGALQSVIAQKCDISLRSVQRIAGEPTPTVAELAVGERETASRRGRPSKADGEVVERVRSLLLEEPRILATEVLRRSREWGYAGSKSAMSVLVKRLRPEPTIEPIVRFEGLPGEYTQFDFGECWVPLADGSSEKVVFFAGRLKYSRYMHVVLVENQRAESVVRSLVACLEAFGGSTKEWVFDNPKTIRLSKWGVKPVVLHSYLRDLVAEYNVIATFCAPRAGNQKGSVENLVGFVKKSFLLARKFRDRADVADQLASWLREVNFERPCDATGVTPEAARQEESRWLAERPVTAPADLHPLRETATVTPTGTVSWGGTPYFASARRIGAPATLLIRRKTIEIIVGGDGAERCKHARCDGAGEVQRLPGQRTDMLAVIHGRRKHATFRRQCLLELGKDAWSFMTGLVHGHPDGCWEGPCTELYELLVTYGDEPMRRAFARCAARKQYTVEAVLAAVLELAA
jgi:transposase